MPVVYIYGVISNPNGFIQEESGIKKEASPTYPLKISPYLMDYPFANRLYPGSLDVDLRSIIPWDRELVYSSVRKTNRVLIVHEDSITMGFGAEIAACIAENCLDALDSPVIVSQHGIALFPLRQHLRQPCSPLF